MNKLFTKLLFTCALLFYTASDVLYAQCTTAIYAVRDTRHSDTHKVNAPSVRWW